MYELIYPTVNLFLYDLRDGLGQSPAEINDNRLNFWCKISPEIDQNYQEIRELTKKLQLQKDQPTQPLTSEATALKTKIEKLEKKLQELEAKEDSETEFVELYYQGFAEQEAYLDGMYFALQMGDTYALQVEASDGTSKDDPAQRKDAPRSLDQLAYLKKLVVKKVNHHNKTIEPKPDKAATTRLCREGIICSHKSAELDANKLGTLGQTWFVWGQATKGITKDNELRKIAQNCFPWLTPDKNWNPDFKEVGELVGARAFEYSHTPKDWGNDKEKFRRENYHLVILLFPGDGTPTNDLRKRIAEDLTIDLIRLFAYRHKIIWSYWNSRRLKVELKKDSQQIAELRQEMEEYKKTSFEQGAADQNNDINLNKLEEKLTRSWLLLAEYATKLNQLHSQSHTIATNLGNYEKRITKIEKDAPAQQPVNLDVFQKFTNTAKERYLQQVTMDYASLGAGLTILENLTRTLDSLVNIERTKAEQQRTKTEEGKNTTIAIAGLGLAASSSVAGIVATQVRQTKDADSSDRISVGQGLAYSSVIPLLVAIILLGIYWYQNHRKSNR